MTKAKDIEIEVLGKRISVPNVVKRLWEAEHQTCEWLEGLAPAEIEELSTLDKWLYHGKVLPARCSYNHRFTAIANLMEEGCPVCEAARFAAETHVAQPIKMAAHSSMRAEVGAVTIKTYSVDLDVLERHDVAKIYDQATFDAFMDQLEKAEGYDMIGGLHAFEFKEQQEFANLSLLDAFIHVAEERVGDDLNLPPYLAPDFQTWDKERQKRQQRINALHLAKELRKKD
jgi:hypothetical protein